ncbi:EpsG family protein [Peribacillus sp. Hz7]|uniref:EpsG family protein n=1 Tax=Peribacillus sp. Hz7 TaxID=3344873 RepID=UPI0035CCA2A1
MLIYVSTLVMIGLYSIGFNILRSLTRDTKKLKIFFVSLATIQLILLLSLRHYTIGSDAPVYVTYFLSMPQYSSFEALLLGHRFEIGYKLLNKLISIFTTNEQIFLTVIACISIIPVGILIYKHSKMPFLSFAIYITFNYYSFVFSGLRQAIGYAIIFISYNFIKDRKLVKFILCVLIAASFHKSALMFLPAYFLANLKLNKFTISGILLFNIIMFVFREQIFGTIISTFYNNYEIVSSLSFTWMLVCSLIVICGLFFYKSVLLISQKNNILYMLVIIGASLMIFSSVGTNVMRVADYYYMFVMLFIPEVMNAVKDKRIILIGGYILIILILILYIWFLKGDGYSIVPYRFFWE